ncbi:hypothetical protein DFS34DRAFT_577444 [Phlyctochytrium arcticum]|nr:hypothetical protein DFS34DRAFT_577444 [Phlyctochytrium arcticum]
MPNIAKVGKATIHSPMPDGLATDLGRVTSILEHFIKGTNQVDAALIPPKIIANAKGIAVITILKAGFLWTGRAGSGVVVARLPDGRWSAPSAIAAVGAGFGAQIGASLTDCVFILNNESAVKAFCHSGNVTLGGSMGVAAGPKGRTAEAAGSIVNLAPIYSYSKSKGLFAGVSLEGSAIVTRNDANRTLYGRKVTAKELLTGEVPPPVEAESLYRVLNFKFSNMGTGVMVQHPVASRGNSLNRVGTANGAPALKPKPGSAGIAGSPLAQTQQVSQSLPSSASTKRAPPVPPSAAAAASQSGQTATALYDYAGERPTDLSFKRGDRITITKAGGPSDWWSGTLNGKAGDFPGNYVEMI